MQKLELQNRKEQKIVGVLEKPNGEIKGTCVVQHGWSGTKGQPHIQVFKNVFLKNGFQTFNFDTTNSFGESDGDYSESRLGLHYEDLEDVAKWVQKQDWYVGPLALTGHSMGGYSVARYAEKYPDEVAYVMPIAPVVSGEFITEALRSNDPNGFKKWEEVGVNIRHSSRVGEIREPWEAVVEWQNHNLLPNAHKMSMPVFLMTGSKDPICSPVYVQKLFDKIPHENKEFQILDGAGHDYKTDDELKEVERLMDEWLKSQL